MLWTRHLLSGNHGGLYSEDYAHSSDHVELKERLRKTLYYGKTPSTDRHSLPVTEFAVEFFQDAAPRQLGQVDTYVAAGYSRRACISPSSLMLSMIYIDRLKHRNPEYLQKVSSTDLFLISMMVASKYLYDEGVDEEVFNDEWAESAKMDVEDVNELERHFLQAIDWNLFVSAHHFWSVLTSVERELALRKGWEHGGYTYTEGWVLTDGQMLRMVTDVMRSLTKMLLVCAVAYMGCVLTMVGATVALTCVRNNAPGLGLVSPQQPPHDVTAGSHRPRIPPPAVSTVPLPAGCFQAGPPEQMLLTFGQNGNSANTDIPANESDANQAARDHPTEAFLKPQAVKDQALPHEPRWKERRRQKMKERYETPAPEHRHLKAQSFLTLSLLQDTLLKFVSAVSETLSSTSPAASHRCSCGFCPITVESNCQNVTLLSCDRLALDALNCDDRDETHCCCPMESSGHRTPWLIEQLRVQPRLNEVTYGFRTASMVT